MSPRGYPWKESYFNTDSLPTLSHLLAALQNINRPQGWDLGIISEVSARMLGIWDS